MTIINVFTKLILPIIIIGISYGIYNIYDLFELGKVVSPTNDKCFTISGAIGIEDIFVYENVLIGASDNRLKLWESNDATENGTLVVINPIEYKIYKKIINNFPQGVDFHPHGIYIYKNTLYAINHAYSKGGERIEVIEINGHDSNDIEFLHKRSLILNDNLMGISNDLAVVGENDELFITSYLPFSDPKEGRNRKSLMKNILEKLILMFRIKLTSVYYCKWTQGKFTCEEVPGTSSLMNNGIAFDYVDKLYVSNTLDRKIKVYQINKEADRTTPKLSYIKDIPIGYATDNVYFDNNTKDLYIGVLGRAYDHMQFIKNFKGTHQIPSNHTYTFGGVQVSTKSNDKVSILSMVKNKMVGVSSAIKLNNLVFLSSWADEGVLVCEV